MRDTPVQIKIEESQGVEDLVTIHVCIVTDMERVIGVHIEMYDNDRDKCTYCVYQAKEVGEII